jgi:hypothetical protein
MRDNDSKSLETLYESLRLVNEDEAGRPYPAYGSNAASTSTPVMGTEPLIQTEVELPEGAGEESESDEEEMEGKDSLGKLIDKIRTTINDYEDKKQLRFNKELEESVINEITFGGIAKGIGNVAKGVGNAVGEFGAAVQSGDPVKYAIDKMKAYKSNKNEYVGYEQNQIEPKVGMILQYASSDVFAKIIKVDPKNKQYTIQLKNYILGENKKVTETNSKFGFKRTKFRGPYGGFEIDDINKATQTTYIVGKGASYNQWLLLSTGDLTDNRLIAAIEMQQQGQLKQQPTSQQPTSQQKQKTPQEGATVKMKNGAIYIFKGGKWVDQNGKPSTAAGIINNAWVAQTT